MKYNYLINKSRSYGKTIRLIIESYKNDYRIACLNKKRIKEIIELSKIIGIKIKKPYFLKKIKRR